MMKQRGYHRCRVLWNKSIAGLVLENLPLIISIEEQIKVLVVMLVNKHATKI